MEIKQYKKNRDRIDIIREILDLLSVAMSKTHIMYSCNLNYRQTNWYLKILLHAELISEKDDKFIIMPKGKTYLDMTVKLAEMMPL